jgi:hypothetical protein
MRYAITLLVEALRYKPEGRGLGSRWGRSHYDPWVDSASKGKQYQRGLLGGKDGHLYVPIVWKSWVSQTPGDISVL